MKEKTVAAAKRAGELMKEKATAMAPTKEEALATARTAANIAKDVITITGLATMDVAELAKDAATYLAYMAADAVMDAANSEESVLGKAVNSKVPVTAPFKVKHVVDTPVIQKQRAAKHQHYQIRISDHDGTKWVKNDSWFVKEVVSNNQISVSQR